MSTELERFRDHCRTMAVLIEPVMRRVWIHDRDGYGRPGWGEEVAIEAPTDAERVLWRQLADEIDAWIHRNDDAQPTLEAM